MPFVRIWVHIVWSTHKRVPVLTQDIRPHVFKHIRENASRKNIFLAEVNGYEDHVHCLISLKKEQNLSYVVQLIKGECAYWVNRHELVPGGLKWQTEYYAVSIGEPGVARMRNYIRNQELHHQKQSFENELKWLRLKSAGG
jgi:putative transposase